MSWLTSLFARVPFLKAAGAFVAGNYRLVIQYLLVAALITVCGFTLSLWFTKEATETRLTLAESKLETADLQLATLSNQIEQAHQVNREQATEIERLEHLRQLDSAAFGEMIGRFLEASRNDAELRSLVAKLEKENASVKTYLDQRIPSELVCVFNNTCAQATSAGPNHRPRNQDH